MDTQALIDALRTRARRFFSLDTPEDADLGDTAIDIGAGFVPVVGTAQAARDFERARREGVSPETMRDRVLLGKAHAGKIDPTLAAGLAAASLGTAATVAALRNRKQEEEEEAAR
jgi:hypothetical protein